MIASLKGNLSYKSPQFIIIECSGVGYKVLISLNTFEKLPSLGSPVFLFAETIVREDSITIFGFNELLEKDCFNLLIEVSGIGPKIALGIMSVISAEDLNMYIQRNDSAFLAKKLPGVGKKTAERLILELKDKISKLNLSSSSSDSVPSAANAIAMEAETALIALGYNRLIASKAVARALKEAESEDISIEVLIKKSLKYALS